MLSTIRHGEGFCLFTGFARGSPCETHCLKMQRIFEYFSLYLHSSYGMLH